MSGWIEHDGGPCPVEPWRMLFIRNRSGWTDEPYAGPNPAGDWRNWEWINDPLRHHSRDIIAYRIVE